MLRALIPSQADVIVDEILTNSFHPHLTRLVDEIERFECYKVSTFESIVFS